MIVKQLFIPPNLNLPSLSRTGYLQHYRYLANTTPIFKNGLCINLASKHDKLPPTKSTQSLPSATDIMMGTGEVEDVNFLPAPSVDISPKLDKQLKT